MTKSTLHTLFIEKNIDIIQSGDFLEDETKKDLKIIKKINQLGFITNDSQTGKRIHGNVPLNVQKWTSNASRLMKRLISKSKESDFVRDIKKEYKDGYHHSLKHSQRAYLSGYLPKDWAFLFHYYMNLTSMVCITSQTNRIPVTYQTGFSPYDPHYPLSKLHVKYLNDQVPVTTRLGFFSDPKENTNYTHHLQQLAPRKSQKALDDFIYIECFDPKHNRKADSKKGLFTHVIETLKIISKQV